MSDKETMSQPVTDAKSKLESRRNLLKLGAAGLPMVVTAKASATSQLTSISNCAFIPEKVSVIIQENGDCHYRSGQETEFDCRSKIDKVIQKRINRLLEQLEDAKGNKARKLRQRINELRDFKERVCDFNSGNIRCSLDDEKACLDEALEGNRGFWSPGGTSDRDCGIYFTGYNGRWIRAKDIFNEDVDDDDKPYIDILKNQYHSGAREGLIGVSCITSILAAKSGNRA